MKRFSTAAPLIISFLLVSASAAAQTKSTGLADSGVPKPVSAFPWFAGVGAGVAYPTLSHPKVGEGGAAAPTLRFHGGYTLAEKFTVGLEFTAVETDVGRDAPNSLFKLGYTPQAECTTCKPKVPGADLLSTSLVMSTVGPRFEFAPFGRDGLFMGATAGLAFMVGLEPLSGFGFGGRLGYRVRPSNIMTISVEGGMEGQLYGDTTMYMPYASATIRPYF